jgi:hypothetical protein
MSNLFPDAIGADKVEENSCFSNIRNCYGYGCEKGDSRSTKRIRETDYEADVLQRELQSLSMKEVNSSEQAVLGHDDKERIILNRAKGNNPDQLLEEPAFVSLKFRELDSEIETIEFLVDRFGFNLKNPGFEAYKAARAQNKAYVDNPDFKIGFLRADRYDPKRAAARMMIYFAEKKDLFGEEKLTKDICLEDLGPKGRKYLGIGGFQVLTKRDTAGRLTVCFADSLKEEEVKEMRLGVRKGYFYMLNCLSEEDTQVGKIKGFVCVCWRVHKQTPPNPQALYSILNLFRCSPIKIAAFHLCRAVTTFELEHFNSYSKMILPVIKHNGILRFFRSHYGTAQECQYTLLKYGCPDLPLREEMNKDVNTVNPFHTRNHKVWFANREKKDSAKAQKLSVLVNPPDDESMESIDYDKMSSGSIRTLSSFDDSDGTFIEEFYEFGPDFPNLPGKIPIYPNPPYLPPADDKAPRDGDPQNEPEPKAETKTEDPAKGCEVRPTDVLLGQAPSLRTHPGNIHFRKVISDKFDKYFASAKKEKTKVAEEIVQQIKREGRRFLKKTSKDGVWIESDDIKQLRYKVAHTFRSIVKRKNKEGNTDK